MALDIFRGATFIVARFFLDSVKNLNLETCSVENLPERARRHVRSGVLPQIESHVTPSPPVRVATIPVDSMPKPAKRFTFVLLEPT